MTHEPLGFPDSYSFVEALTGAVAKGPSIGQALPLEQGTTVLEMYTGESFSAKQLNSSSQKSACQQRKGRKERPTKRRVEWHSLFHMET